MPAIKRLWQPLEWSQRTVSPIGILSLLMICVLAFYIIPPMSGAYGGYAEAAGAFITSAIALGQGIPAVGVAATAIAGEAAATAIIGPCLVVAAGAAAIGYGVAATIEAISEDREQERGRDNPTAGVVVPKLC